MNGLMDGWMDGWMDGGNCVLSLCKNCTLAFLTLYPGISNIVWSVSTVKIFFLFPGAVKK